MTAAAAAVAAPFPQLGKLRCGFVAILCAGSPVLLRRLLPTPAPASLAGRPAAAAPAPRWPGGGGAAGAAGPRPGSESPMEVSVDAATVLGEVAEGMTGCHVDLGYDHQIYGFYAQRLYGESFEEFTGTADTQPCCGNMWRTTASPTVQASFQLNRTNPLNGLVSQSIHFEGGNGTAAVSNRGFSEEGLHLVGGMEYEGYIFVRSSMPAQLRISLEDYITGEALAVAEVTSPSGEPADAWHRLTFSLWPDKGTSCEGYPELTKPLMCKTAGRPAHGCVRCSGQFSVGLTSPGQVDLDYAYLSPGEWGRFKGLPVLKESVEWMLRGGYSSIRLGGTHVESQKDQNDTKSPGYLWKKLRGPAWARGGPMPTTGGAAEGLMVTRGWAIFEMVAMCEAMGVEPVLTLHGTETAEDLGDLVEYLLAADAASNPWARLRSEDGHPAPYRVRWIEIGNEDRPPNATAKALAMEKRARALGMGGVLRYIIPGTFGYPVEVVDDEAGRELGRQLYLDLHTNALSLEQGRQWTQRLQALKSLARLVVLETNTRRHDFSRVLQEGVDLNELQRHAHSEEVRIDLRVESFCMEKSGHDPGLDARHGYLGDQGAVFFLQNQTYGQPPYFVHQLVTTNHQPFLVKIISSMEESDSKVSLFAARSRSGGDLVVRAVNQNNKTTELVLKLGPQFDGDVPGMSFLNTSSLSSGGLLTADNPPYEPERYSPQSEQIPTGGRAGTRITLAPLSFTVITARALAAEPL